MKFLLTCFYLLLQSFAMTSKCQSSIDFSARLDPDIGTRHNASVHFTIKNNSKNTLVIPSIIFYNSISIDTTTMDIGFELYEYSNGKYIFLDSCNMLIDPVIPEEGIVLKKYNIGEIFSDSEPLPVFCLHVTKKYKIRFRYFAKYENGQTQTIKTKWIPFTTKKPLF